MTGQDAADPADGLSEDTFIDAAVAILQDRGWPVNRSDMGRVWDWLAARQRPTRQAATDRAAVLAEVVAAVEAIYPPYNCELRPDGSEDPVAAAYVDAFREVDNVLDRFRAAIAAASTPADPRTEVPLTQSCKCVGGPHGGYTCEACR